MAKLLCVNDRFPATCARPWFPIEGQTYTVSIIKGRRVTLLEDTLLGQIGDFDSAGRIPLDDGRWPYRCDRFVDITGIEIAAEKEGYREISRDPDIDAEVK